jgi:hypothetical protein
LNNTTNILSPFNNIVSSPSSLSSPFNSIKESETSSEDSLSEEEDFQEDYNKYEGKEYITIKGRKQKKDQNGILQSGEERALQVIKKGKANREKKSKNKN